MLRYQDWEQEQTLLVYLKYPTDAQVSGLGTGAEASSLLESIPQMLRYQDWEQEQTLLVYVKDPTDAQVSGLGAGADTSIVYVKDPTDAQVSGLGAGADSSSLRAGSHRCSGIRPGDRSRHF
jgi:hypothetical protein